jgi:hypothetical protein
MIFSETTELFEMKQNILKIFSETTATGTIWNDTEHFNDLLWDHWPIWIWNSIF